MKSRILVKLGLPGMVAALSLGLAACGGGGGGGPASETGGDGGTDTPTGTAEKPTVVHISKGAEQLPGGTKVYGKVTSDGGAPLTRAGVCYGLTEETVYGDCIDAAGPKVGEDFSVTLPVAPSKTYYYKPFAENSAGLRGYAEGIGAFVRPEKVTPPPPEVKTGRCLGENSFTPVHAELCGQVLSVGSSESKLTDRGVCWVSASDPNAGDPKPGDGTSACTPCRRSIRARS